MDKNLLQNRRRTRVHKHQIFTSSYLYQAAGNPTRRVLPGLPSAQVKSRAARLLPDAYLLVLM